jgi:enediyne biosynthesis protein E4
VLCLACALGASAQAIKFTNATAAAGIKFTHNAGKAGKRWLPETMGAGVAWFDADGDEYPDLLFVNSRDWTPRGKRSTHALYKNNRNGTFTDVTAGSGLDVQVYGMGVAAGDFDGDGKLDLYITALEGDRLYRNLGGYKFADVTAASGITNKNFGTSAAFVDFDKDGRLDLFVANYVQWTEKGDVFCSLDGTAKSYCTPESYKGTSSKLYRNVGGGKFEDVSAKAGVGDATSKSLGVLVVDFDGDTWPDLFVANDTQPNKLYKNNRNGTFSDVAMAAGVAYSEDGVARGAMGVDAMDYDGSGRPHILVGNFSNQMLGLYHNEGNGLFVDEAPRSTVGRSSLLTLAFGVFFFDYDNDGRADIYAANGHIEEDIGRVQPKVSYAQPPLIFRNEGAGKFADVSKALGADVQKALVARGAAYADYDRDGDLDVVVTSNNGAAVLYRNDGGNRNGYLNVRAPIGTRVTVTTSSGKQWQTVKSGGSYCSQSDLMVHFGLGGAETATVELAYPSGKSETRTNVKARQHLVFKGL